jgi:hypothetical protein
MRRSDETEMELQAAVSSSKGARAAANRMFRMPGIVIFAARAAVEFIEWMPMGWMP